MTMKNILILVCLTLLPFLSVQANETSDFTLSRIQVLPIKDTQADRQYELYIKLPEGYSKNKDKIYPVIYLTDALWQIELLSGATEFMMEDAILVGISWQKDINEALLKEKGEHISRSRDYSISKSSNPEIQAKYQLGQASNHLTFIRNDVIKTIEKNYRTDPDNRTYFGFSSGGRFGAYILMAQPDTFKNYILGSPSLWRDIPLLFSLENPALKSKTSAINLFISYGELEERLSPHIEDFVTKLKAKKYEGLSSIKHVVIESSGHSDSFPMLGVRSVKWLSNLSKEENK
ncbi:hydrolase [Colwellia sp. 75C3]|uniref:alpha/beta hydrolase n=1 Tax=Colwellia sp. 75C3 TaxID=888425 RepID=UPI000C3448E2|nr:alpha/beta hydrolase-fold protein [Colwellia sp. 75C3]PKG86219.1 hydrolase [Colwellia sp. 75C3]